MNHLLSNIQDYLMHHYSLLLAPGHLQAPVVTVGLLCLFFNLLLPVQKSAIVGDLLLEVMSLSDPLRLETVNFTVEFASSVSFVGLHDLVSP